MAPQVAVRPSRRRLPRRRPRQLRLAAAVAVALEALERLDRQAPLRKDFVAELEALRRAAAPLLARAGQNLAVSPLGPGPVSPGMAFVALLKLQCALAPAVGVAGI
jgi:hypothetical protein